MNTTSDKLKNNLKPLIKMIKNNLFKKKKSNNKSMQITTYNTKYHSLRKLKSLSANF